LFFYKKKKEKKEKEKCSTCSHGKKQNKFLLKGKSICLLKSSVKGHPFAFLFG
jgi:hypothetical protein